ncbi:hypothetical protein FACS1894169_10870 [Bacteroidia bacterium]|nr:hypothetical protein FACS1894169_10870 [Bacteroidia bacterium]
MKKLVLFAVVAIAISLASCGDNKAKEEAAAKAKADSIAAVEAQVAAEAAAKAQADSIAQVQALADSLAAATVKK